jgi:hypothetical protein
MNTGRKVLQLHGSVLLCAVSTALFLCFRGTSESLFAQVLLFVSTVIGATVGLAFGIYAIIELMSE